MYKLNKNLASHLSSLEKVDYFLHQGFDAIECRIGLFGGRKFNVSIEGKKYFFKLNSLILHVYKVHALKAKEDERYHLSRIVNRLKALEASKPCHKVSACQKHWTTIRSNWGKKHFDRDFYFKQLLGWDNPKGKLPEKVTADGFRRIEIEDPVDDLPDIDIDPAEAKPQDPPKEKPKEDNILIPQALPKEKPKLENFPIPQPFECEAILKDERRRKGIEKTSKIMAIPKGMKIPTTPEDISLIDDLKKTIQNATLPQKIIDDGKHVQAFLARTLVLEKLEILKTDVYWDRYNRRATPELLEEARTVLKHISQHLKMMVEEEDYKKAVVKLYNEFKALNDELNKRLVKIDPLQDIDRQEIPYEDQISNLLVDINLPAEKADVADLSKNIADKFAHNSGWKLDPQYDKGETAAALLEITQNLTRFNEQVGNLARKRPIVHVITRLYEAFNHSNARLATGFEDLYFDLINLPKINYSATLEEALPLHLYLWRWQGMQFACSFPDDRHQTATARFVRKNLSGEFGIMADLSTKGNDYEEFAKFGCLATAKGIFEQYFNPMDICQNISQLLDDKEILRKEFLDWCEKEGYSKNQVVLGRKVEKGFILYYLLKNQYFQFKDVQNQ